MFTWQIKRTRKRLRFSIVLIVFALLLFLFWREYFVMDWVLSDFTKELNRTIIWKEINLRRIIQLHLEEPIIEVERRVKNYIDSMHADAVEFRKWLSALPKDSSIIGGGLVWSRDSKEIDYTAVNINADQEWIKALTEYYNLRFDPDYYKQGKPDWMKAKEDSLSEFIEGRYGYTRFSQYNRFNQPLKSKQSWQSATDTLFGIIWNADNYKKYKLTHLIEEIKSNPIRYGIFLFLLDFPMSSDWYHGILLVDEKNDTLFSWGQVEQTPYLSFRGGIPVFYTGKTLPWTPGWTLFVQEHNIIDRIFRTDRADQTVIGRIFHNYYVKKAENINNSHFQGKQDPDAYDNWLLLAGSLLILFVVIAFEVQDVRNQRKFIFHISHELRTPVAKIRLFAETLRHDRAVSEQKENQYLDTIVNESDHLAVLIDNSLNLSRIEADRLKIRRQKVSLAEWLQEFVDKHRAWLEGVGFEVKLDIENDLPAANIDPEAFDLVMRNLIDNAVKYSDKRKEIEIRAKRTYKNKIRLEVADRGIGIPQNKRKSIFKRFVKVVRKDREPIGGAGVGLSLVKEIIDRHRGKIWCEGRESGGSLFIIRI